MPIYEYECNECSWRFEKKQRFHDDPVAECPKCQSKSKRIMVPSQIIFKGSGFYVNDYPKNSNGGSSTKSSPAAKTQDNPAKPVSQKTADSSTATAGASKTESSSTQPKTDTSK
jgi:putative FmdB family regulatory protein